MQTIIINNADLDKCIHFKFNQCNLQIAEKMGSHSSREHNMGKAISGRTTKIKLLTITLTAYKGSGDQGVTTRLQATSFKNPQRNLCLGT